MSDAYAKFHPFFQGLPEACDVAIFDNAPGRRACGKSRKNTTKAWKATMRPYIASVMWLAFHFAVNGPEAARETYLKLGADRRALVRIGYAIVFENGYQFEQGYTYTRADMFVGVDVKEGEFPVRTLTNMRLGTYLRLTKMGGVAA